MKSQNRKNYRDSSTCHTCSTGGKGHSHLIYMLHLVKDLLMHSMLQLSAGFCLDKKVWQLNKHTSSIRSQYMIASKQLLNRERARTRDLSFTLSPPNHPIHPFPKMTEDGQKSQTSARCNSYTESFPFREDAP